MIRSSKSELSCLSAPVLVPRAADADAVLPAGRRTQTKPMGRRCIARLWLGACRPFPDPAKRAGESPRFARPACNSTVRVGDPYPPPPASPGADGCES
jgi:hypothetical protein